MKALVTGANGHIGSHVVRACIEGGLTPIGFVRPHSDRRALAGLDIELREGDLLDAASLERAMAGVERVFHVGAVHRNFDTDRTRIIRPAVEGTRNVIQAAIRAGVRRMVHTSTGATIGFATDPGRPLDESAHAEHAASPYSQGKIEAEKLALAAAREGRIEVVTVNPSGVFGPLDYRITPASRAFLGMLQGDPAMLAVCFTDVRDVAAGHIAAGEKGKNGERYLLTGDLLAPREIAHTFSSVTGIRPPAMRPPRFVISLLATLAERKARHDGTDAPITRAQLTDVWGRHLAYDSHRARAELGILFRPAAEVVRDAARWLLFLDAVKPAVAERVRATLGSAAAPDPAWVPASHAPAAA